MRLLKMYEDINCPSCKESNWTHESTIISGIVFITCKCGHEIEVKKE